MEQERLELPFEVVNEHYELPCYARAGDGGLDLSASESLVVGPLERALVGTGIALGIPEGYCGLLLPRSGLALRSGVTLLNAPGLIDAGYRGEIRVVLYNSDREERFEVAVGDRIAQLLVLPFPYVVLSRTERLAPSERGENGFGHSGR
ncbi:MAG: dUTP diphosphatase [Acidimicrobiales bacterium]